MKILNFISSAGVFASAGGFFERLSDRYFKRTLENYANFDFGENQIPLAVIIGGIILGVIAAFFAMTLYKKTVCAFVELLLKKGAVGKENAIAFSELGVSELMLKKLESSTVLRNTVHSLDQEDFYENAETLNDDGAKKTDLPPYKIGKNDRLYIPEDKKYFAEIHFETGSATWSKFLLISLLCVGGFFLLMELVPMLLGVVDGFIGSM